MVIPILVRACMLVVVFVAPVARGSAEPVRALPSAERRLQAVRTSTPVEVDGRLTEEDWQRAPAAADFTQSEPLSGQPASEATAVRVLFDDTTLYVGVFAAHTDTADIIVNELRRDFDGTSTDWFAVIVDPFLDRRNGYQFGVNPAGAQWDSQKFNEGRERNLSWDGVWHVRTSLAAEGWYAEYAIPFRTLQVPEGSGPQQWGINFQRHLQGRLENSFWAPVPRQYGLDRLSLAGTLEGIAGIRRGLNLRVKPYVSASARGGTEDDASSDAGIDVKYGITSGLVADLSVRTDFSQVEADVQQLGATRFSVLFPEKREFFLENSGVFQFGPGNDRTAQISAAPGASAGGRDNSVQNALALFFSRRIGLSAAGDSVPIQAGARVSGRVGSTAVGALHVRQDAAGDEPAASFTVVRARQNLAGASDIGVMLVSRDATARGSRAWGLDVNLRPLSDLVLYGYVAGSSRPAVDRRGRAAAAQAGAAWRDGRWVFDLSYGLVGGAFSDEAGFVPRLGIWRAQALAGRRFRPAATRSWLREIYPAVGLTDIRREGGGFDSRYAEHRLAFTFERGASVEIGANPNEEQLTSPFIVHRTRGLAVAPGRYRFTDRFVAMTTTRSKPIVLEARVSTGGYYDGRRQVIQAGVTGRMNAHLSGGFSYARDRVELRTGEAATGLLIGRVNVGFSTRTFLNGLVQHNSATGQWDTNLRFNYIHGPLSDLFVVYTQRPGNRSVAIKVTRLVAF